MLLLVLVAGAILAADPPPAEPEKSPPVRAEAGPKPKPGEPARRVAVFDLEATGVEPALAQAASLVLPTEVRARTAGAPVIGNAEVEALLGLEKQREMLGCGTSECMAEIAGALGVDELVSGRLGKVGKTYVLELRRMNVRSARVLGSAIRTVRGEADALIEALRSAVAQLYPAPSPDLSAHAAAPEVTVATPARPSGLSQTFSWALAGGGGAIMVVSGIGLASASKISRDYDEQQSGTPGTATVTRDQARTAKKVATASWIGLAIGGAITTWGILRLSTSPTVPGVAAAPIPGGAAVAMAGSF